MNQLCEEYEVSVTTARRAPLELANEGVTHRRLERHFFRHLQPLESAG